MAYISCYYVAHGLAVIIALLLLAYAIKTVKFYKQFPVLHILPYLLYCKVFRKVSKDVPITYFAFKKMTEKCMQHMEEGLCMTYIAGPILLIFGEEPVKVFSTEKSSTNKPEAMYHLFRDTFGPGLATRSGEKWKSRRKILNPAFSLGMLKEKVPIFNEHALAFVKDLEILVARPSADPLEIIKYHYFNSLSESVFGLKQAEEYQAENIKFLRNVDSLAASTIIRLACPILHWKFMLSTFSYGRQILRMHEELFDFTKNAVLNLKKHIISKETLDPGCFSKNMSKSFSYILLHHHMNDPSFTFDDLVGEVTNFMAAGYDTVSYTTLWCLFMLGLYPDVQENAYNEVQFASRNSFISYEDCSSFTYLEAVILETLRLYPTVPLFAKELSEDVQYGERKITKDTIIAHFPYVMHRNPDIYPDPEAFDPERFLGSRKNYSWTYKPFAEGYRNCIGKKFALIEMTIFLAYFLRQFKITSLDRREDIELNWAIVLSPTKPLRMNIERR